MRLSALVDSGAETLIFYPEKHVINSRGESVAIPDLDHPVTVRGSVSAGRQSDSELAGEISNKVITVFCRSIPNPGGSWALVKFRGEEWDVAGPVTDQRQSLALTHIEIHLRSRNKVAT